MSEINRISSCSQSLPGEETWTRGTITRGRASTLGELCWPIGAWAASVAKRRPKKAYGRVPEICGPVLSITIGELALESFHPSLYLAKFLPITRLTTNVS